MPKIAYFTVLSVVVLIIVTAINIHGVSASKEIKYNPVSVLAQDQANYMADQNTIRFHRVSEAIVADAARDLTPPDSVTTIPYTIPPHKDGPAANDEQPSVTGPEDENQNDDVSVSDPDPDDGSDQDQDKDKDKDKDSGKDKDKGKDNNKDKDKGAGDKNGKDKNDDKESKPPKDK